MSRLLPVVIARPDYFFIGTGAGDMAGLGVPPALGVGDGLCVGPVGVGENTGEGAGEAAGLGLGEGFDGTLFPPPLQAADSAATIESTAVAMIFVFIGLLLRICNADLRSSADRHLTQPDVRPASFRKR